MQYSSETENENEDAENLVLTEMVRKHYVNYLERKLRENINAWQRKYNNADKDFLLANLKLKECVEELEDACIKSCMMSQPYQRAMVQIIAIVSRSTKEYRLVETLNELMKKSAAQAEIAIQNALVDKATQTEYEQINNNGYNNNNNDDIAKGCTTNEAEAAAAAELTLEQKIDLFQAEFINKTENESLPETHIKNNSTPVKRVSNGSITKICEKRRKLKSPILVTTPPTPPTPTPEDKHQQTVISDVFEIFGIDLNSCAETEDPEITSMLNEIQWTTKTRQQSESTATANSEQHNTSKHVTTTCLPDVATTNDDDDLSKSLWPCELYMQRRALSASLTTLLEEDIRWHDIIKWKFQQYFGEDSDDEFEPCSPTIDLVDEVLKGSCIRRISPWIVKHLMKPLKDGLIANRFLFKKLAHKLAHSIILDNQYPSEKFVKEAIEYFFCLKISVHSVNDLNDMDSISFSNYI